MTGEEDNNAQVIYCRDFTFLLQNFKTRRIFVLIFIFQALLDYFQPLITYLEDQRAEHNYPIGWNAAEHAMMNIFLIFGLLYFFN